MNICQIILNDCNNGYGIRLSIFVSGCTNQCKGCFQPETWDFNYGQKLDSKTIDGIIKELGKPQYRGITILGGEPFEILNQKDVYELIKTIRTSFPKKDIWVYTGNNLEDLTFGGKRHTEYTDEILRNIDVLVDGKFDESLKDFGIKFRGSSNQRLIDMKRTLATNNGEIVLLEGEEDGN